MNAHTFKAGPVLSAYQLECWAALGRLLTPFLDGAVTEIAAPVAEEAAWQPVGEVAVEVPVLPVFAAEPLAPIEWPASLVPAEAVAEPTEFNLAEWFLLVETPEPEPMAAVMPTAEPMAAVPVPVLAAEAEAAPVLEPIAALRQGAGEFFSGLAWTAHGKAGRPAAGLPTAAAAARAPDPPGMSAADFFGQGVAWGGEARAAAGEGFHAPDALGSRMMAAATQSAVHLSRKMAGQDAPAMAAEPSTAREFFGALDWQRAPGRAAVPA